MKKVFFVFLLAIISLASCQKEKNEVVGPENGMPEIQVRFGDEQLKSGGILIGEGDTISLLNNYHIIFWATKNGSPANIYWEVEQTLSIDPPLALSPHHNAFGDIMAYKPIAVGYYKFTIAEHPGGPAIQEFYAIVRTLNYPGQIGDGPDNDYIFRIDKVFYPATGENKLFVYFKFSQDHYQQVGATLIGWPPEGGIVDIELTKYDFNWTNDSYYVCILDIPENISYLATGIEYWSYNTNGDKVTDKNNYLSSWYTEFGTIQFLIY